MSTKKATKRALLTSILAICMCLVMLVGSTFAWFTDTASTGVNTITSGNLHVAIRDEADTKDIATLDWIAADSRAQNEILWEPGCTYTLTPFVVKNTGSLALKYKLVVTGLEGDAALLDVIKFSYEIKTNSETKVLDLNEEGHLLPGAVSGVITVSAHMDEAAGNTYQDKTLENVKITVYATQDTVENDSYGPNYDADATYPAYPDGVTKDSFNDNQKAVDEDGNYYESFKDALENVADNGKLYFKEDSVVDFPTHLNVTKNVTIYGNGANFSGKDISIGTYANPENEETTINIYNTKNLVVWGEPKTNGSTWNVNFYNCENDGYNFLMYRDGEASTDKINLTMTNCKATGYGDSIVHTTADGTIVIKNCTFADNCAPVNIAHKQSGTMNVTVENSKFINCGKVDTANDYFAPARFVNNSTTGTLNITLTNNTFTGTIGTNGDILLGDYREGKASNALTATINSTSPVMVKSSAEAPYSVTSQTINLG